MALIEVQHLKKYFDVPNGTLHAVDDVSFKIEKGTTMGVVGESGCGKSTLGTTLIHLQESTGGKILFEGRDVTHLDKKELRTYREDVQIIFQDPYSSLNPRYNIARTIMEPLEISGRFKSKEEIRREADRIMDLLMNYHSLDIEWGNHDILWMGAAAGSEACIATVIRNNLKYHNIRILENSYGISLRDLTLFAEKLYPDTEPMEAALKAISVLLFKLEGQVILRNPDYQMTDKLLLHQVNVQNHTVCIAGTDYEICEETFPTVSFDPSNLEVSYELTAEEKQIMEGLRMAFVGSVRLRQHMDFLYQKGSMYRIFNGNLLFHGCVPLDESGNLEGVVFHQKRYRGRDYLDYAERIARRAWSKDATQKELDFMWYLWCGRKSPLSGRNIKTFERTYVLDENTWFEQSNPYYKFYHEEKICNMILHEFGLYSERSHIINGHTPVRTSKGEHPVRAEGKLLVIDGGFCKSYHKTTGIAGYTLIFNSHGIRIKSHQPFQSVYAALTENKDIESKSELVETEKERLMVRDTDSGKKIKEDIDGLKMLLQAYRNGDFEI